MSDGDARPAVAADGRIDLDAFVAMAAQLGHGKALQFQLRAHGADWVELELPWRAELVADPETGTMASGAIISLLDMVGGTSCWLPLERFLPIATIDLHVDYLRPALKGETVIARADCYRLTRSVGFTRGQAHGGDPARPIVSFSATYMLNP